jgi:ferredoxin
MVDRGASMKTDFLTNIERSKVSPKVGIVYMSPNGSTRDVANLLVKELAVMGEVRLFNLSDYESDEGRLEIQNQLAEIPILGIGTPVYQLTMLDPIKHLLKGLPSASATVNEPRKAFCFTTFGGVNSGKTLLHMCTNLHSRGFEILGALKLLAPHFYDEDVEFPIREDRTLVLEFAVIVRQRLEKPVEWNVLKKKLNCMSTKVKVLYPFVRAFGRFRVTKIEFDKDLCTVCGACENACPVHAITAQDLPRKRNGCLHCFNCVMACPTGAMYADVEEARSTIRFNEKHVGGEPDREIF